MRLTKKHITIAFITIIFMFIIFTIFNFISTNKLFYIGNLIESKIGVFSNIDVEKVRSFVTTISSGILGSAIVALVFYINEYNSRKRESIYLIIRESNKLQKLYMDFPYVPNIGEYYKLERQYYLEYLRNNHNEELNKELNKELDKIKDFPTKDKKSKEFIIEFVEQIKNMKKINSYEYEEKLRALLLKHPEYRKRRFSDDIIDEDQKLKDIIINYDIYIDKMMENITCLMNYNLDELELCVNEFLSVFNFSRRKKRFILKHFKEEIVESKRIYPYDLNDVVSLDTIVGRLYEIHTRFNKKIETNLQIIEDNNEYTDRMSALSQFLWIQDDIYGTDIKVISETKIDYAYNKLNMCIDNLQNILLGEISNKYKYYSQDYYVRRGESVEYGYMTKSIVMHGDLAYGDIYRK